MFFTARNGDDVHVIGSAQFRKILEIAEPVEYATASEMAGRHELARVIEEEKWKPLIHWNSGESIEGKPRAWEEKACLYEYDPDYFMLEVWMEWKGTERLPDHEPPMHYEVYKGYLDGNYNVIEEGKGDALELELGLAGGEE